MRLWLDRGEILFYLIAYKIDRETKWFVNPKHSKERL